VNPGDAVIDACSLLNLLATRRAPELVGALRVQLIVVPAVRMEAVYLNGPPNETGEVVREPADLGPLEASGLLRVMEPGEDAADALVAAAAELADNDAASVALAAALGVQLVTDDGKERRVCQNLFPRVEVVSTLALLRQAAGAVGLDRESMRVMLRDLRVRGSFEPPRSDPNRGWFWDLHGRDE
jgi:predicted nucleic acid-binding protein